MTHRAAADCVLPTAGATATPPPPPIVSSVRIAAAATSLILSTFASLYIDKVDTGSGVLYNIQKRKRKRAKVHRQQPTRPDPTRQFGLLLRTHVIDPLCHTRLWVCSAMCDLLLYFFFIFTFIFF